MSGRAHPNTLGVRFRRALDTTLPAGYRPLEGPVVLRLRFVFGRGGTKLAVPVNEPALEELVRSVTHELAGVAYADARQVAAIHAGKEYGNVNGIEARW